MAMPQLFGGADLAGFTASPERAILPREVSTGGAARQKPP